MARPQVRIDPLVAEHLTQEYGQLVSLSAAANSALRDRYGLDHHEPSAEPTIAPLAASAPARPATTSRRPGALGRRCPHPLSARRVGGICAACGTRL